MFWMHYKINSEINVVSAVYFYNDLLLNSFKCFNLLTAYVLFMTVLDDLLSIFNIKVTFVLPYLQYGIEFWGRRILLI